MFRARFHEVFPGSVPHYGPQDIEKGVEESPPDEGIERLLCALLGLVLNRKKEVEYVATRQLMPCGGACTRAFAPPLVMKRTTNEI